MKLFLSYAILDFISFSGLIWLSIQQPKYLQWVTCSNTLFFTMNVRGTFCFLFINIVLDFFLLFRIPNSSRVLLNLSGRACKLTSVFCYSTVSSDSGLLFILSCLMAISTSFLMIYRPSLFLSRVSSLLSTSKILLIYLSHIYNVSSVFCISYRPEFRV